MSSNLCRNASSLRAFVPPCLRACSILCFWVFLTPLLAQSSDPVIITTTLQGAVGQPQIHVQLRHGQTVLEGKSLLADLDLGLEGVLGQGGMDRSFVAYLDTGASAYVISRSTASRFGVAPQPDAVFHEVGLHGETPMDVSRPYVLALADSNGKLIDSPVGAFKVVDRQAVMQMTRSRGDAEQDAVMAMTMGEINIVGMPAIRQFVVEIDPSPMAAGGKMLDPEKADLDLAANLDDIGAAPAVRLHAAGSMPTNVDLRIALDMVDFNRHRNPHDRGSKPSLAANPVIRGITTTHGGKTFRGDWLLDTGAAISIISTKQAKALGLFDAVGNPVRPPDFTMGIGGISGQVSEASGYVLGSLEVPDQRGRKLVYRPAYAIVHDIGIKLDDGTELILDGVFGLNLLLPTMGGIVGGLPSTVADGPFKRVWIDSAGKTLGLELR